MKETASELLDTQRMYAADNAAVERGVTGETLMENAGRAVAEAIKDRFRQGAVLVLCGPGNNGGDGFVIARYLQEWGWPVRLALLGDLDQLKGDAAKMAARWNGPSEAIEDVSVDGASLVVDALFGAGLTRAITGAGAARLSDAVDADLPIVAVDVPSGVSGDSGANLGGAVSAALTVTFFRKKPGHCLLPGRALCGETLVVDIGIPESVLDGLSPSCFENGPALWVKEIPVPGPGFHKYSRGHALISGGPEMLGAARLATRSAQRAGAGIVTLAAPVREAPLYRLALESAVIPAIKDTKAFSDLIVEKKVSAILIGPGLGLMTPGALERVLAVLRAGVPVILDADALTLFQDRPELLFETATAPVLMTPHEGEFARVFPDIAASSDPDGKVGKARTAARRSGFTILLKGYDTVIATPDGRVAINTNATPYLATAGSGDVLAGTALGLISQGMPLFEAAGAATWIHAEAGQNAGIGLIAEDLPDLLPQVLGQLVRFTQN